MGERKSQNAGGRRRIERADMMNDDGSWRTVASIAALFYSITCTEIFPLLDIIAALSYHRPKIVADTELCDVTSEDISRNVDVRDRRGQYIDRVEGRCKCDNNRCPSLFSSRVSDRFPPLNIIASILSLSAPEI